MYDESIRDEMLFDRLVDGELISDERRRLLESLETRPDGWRRCALAFLEAQSWREDLGQVAREGVEAAPARETSLTVPPPHPQRFSGKALATLAIAASLLIGFTLGGLQRDVRQSVDRFAELQADRVEQFADSSPSPSAPAETKTDDALTLWVLDDGGKTRPVRVPLMDAGTLNREFGLEFQPSLSAEARNRLQQQGYAVQSKQRYAPLWLENGRPMVVPVEDMKIMPVVY